MGIIKRQGIKQSLVHYLATALGALSVVLVYPYSDGVYALAGFLTGTAALVAPFASLGANSITIRFFPKFSATDQNHFGFLGLILSFATINMLIFWVVLYLLRESLFSVLDTAGFDVGLMQQYGVPIIILSIAVVWTNVLTSYSSNFGRIVIPTIFNSLIYKIALPILVILSIWKFIDPLAFSWYVVGYYLIGVAGLIGYVYYLGEWKVRPQMGFLNWPLVKQMGLFAIIGMLGSLGSTLTYQIDRVMVPTLMDLKQADVYNIALFIGNSIEIPVRTIIAVTSPLIVKAWYDRDTNAIKNLYQKASNNLLIIGLFLFVGIWLSLDDLFQLTSKYELLKAGHWVVFMVGITKLFDLATSVNGQIIGYSKYYYFNLIAVILLGIMNAYLNYAFIEILALGLIGPALASFFSISLFNLLRVWFIWYQFKMLPFLWSNLWATLLAVACYYLVWSVPDIGTPIFDIIKNSVLIAIIFIPFVYYFKLSEDINQVIDNTLKRFYSSN